MDDSMVTARMLDEKKRKGARILAREGLSAKDQPRVRQMIEEGEAGFLRADSSRIGDEAKWAAASRFVDSLSSKRASRFDDMTKAEVRMERLRSRGMM